MKKLELNHFRKIVWDYFTCNKRQMPWRDTYNPYYIMVSEIMLQQTQVSRVIFYYERFIKRFPTIQALANATVSDVVHAWQGLGYNRRALFLLRAAKQIVRDFKGKMPNSLEELKSLPGIGVATAGAICVYAFNQPQVFVETNIRTVIIHHFFSNKKVVTDAQIYSMVEKTLDMQNPREWYYALMDYGAMLKRNFGNSARQSAVYMKQKQFNGSNRQIRGLIVRMLSRVSRATIDDVVVQVNAERKRVTSIIDVLEKEGFVVKKGTEVMMVT